MNCLYCQRTISTHMLDHTRMDFNCNHCNANFNCISGVIISILWRNIKIDGREYCVKMYPGPTGNAPSFIIYYIKKGGSGLSSWCDLLRFDFIPQNWTPQNIAQKIKELLPYL